MKILTVEDNDINAMLMERLFSELEFSVEHAVAETGLEAVDKSASNQYDLVLMDINLGDGQMDGVQVMKHLRGKETYKAVPIFAVTCYALPGDKERFLDQGFDEYVSKPIDHQVLLDKISEYREKPAS